MLYGTGTIEPVTLLLCQASGWCHNWATGWDKRRGKWVCGDCKGETQHGHDGSRNDVSDV